MVLENLSLKIDFPALYSFLASELLKLMTRLIWLQR